jgi:hypothetical protein
VLIVNRENLGKLIRYIETHPAPNGWGCYECFAGMVLRILGRRCGEAGWKDIAYFLDVSDDVAQALFYGSPGSSYDGIFDPAFVGNHLREMSPSARRRGLTNVLNKLATTGKVDWSYLTA